MRRCEKAITDKTSLLSVIQQAKICRLGLSDCNQPYVVPLSFGYENGCLYFHAAQEGRKIDVIRNNNSVCFQFDTEIEIVENEHACEWDMKYKSIIGFGKASFVEDLQEKREALAIIMRHYSNRSFSFSEQSVAGTAVIKVEIENMTGKQSGY